MIDSRSIWFVFSFYNTLAFLQAPESLNVTVGAVAEFICRADGDAVFWTVNDISLIQLDDPNIIPDNGPVVDGVRTEILRIMADAQYNNSEIQCTSFIRGGGETASEPAVLMIQGIRSIHHSIQACAPSHSKLI